MVEIRARSQPVDQILASFVSGYGEGIECSVLIWRSDAPARWRTDLRPLMAFRNGVALATVLRGRAESVNGFSGMSPTFSDVFDVHPANVGGTGHLILQSPAYLDITSPRQRRVFTPSPYVARQTAPFWHDLYLFDAISKVWGRRFGSRPREARYADRLFRSLEAAYQACAVGARHDASLNDYGTQIALWISAIEILAWPANRNVNRDIVLEYLASPVLGPRALRRRFRVTMKVKQRREVRSLTALQRAYYAMYKARNDFLHGNPVGIATLLVRRRHVTSFLPRIAALVYRAALVVYLDRAHRKQCTTIAEIGSRILEAHQDSAYEEAIDQVFGLAH